jgi:hypothetical protein
MQWAINYGIGNVCFSMYCLRNGLTMYHINKFDKDTFFDQLLNLRVSIPICVIKKKYLIISYAQPRILKMYPYIAIWLSRHPRLEEVSKAGFLKHIQVGGWVLDSTTISLLAKSLPGAHIQQVKDKIIHCAQT